MASLKVLTFGNLVKYVTESSLKNARSNLYRSTTVRHCSTEKKTAEVEPEKQYPQTLEECHKQLETLTSEVTTLKDQVKDYEDKYKRALADAENVRRRMTKQVEDAKSFAIQSFCKDLLDVADTLSAAAESVPSPDPSPALRAVCDGLRLTKAQLHQVFARHGLVPISPLKEKFDPNLHEALFQQEVEGAEPGTVVAVSKIGYKLHERCVRPALVGVAKG